MSSMTVIDGEAAFSSEPLTREKNMSSPIVLIETIVSSQHELPFRTP
jgi:hypothetical protein